MSPTGISLLTRTSTSCRELDDEDELYGASASCWRSGHCKGRKEPRPYEVYEVESRARAMLRTSFFLLVPNHQHHYRRWHHHPHQAFIPKAVVVDTACDRVIIGYCISRFLSRAVVEHLFIPFVSFTVYHRLLASISVSNYGPLCACPRAPPHRGSVPHHQAPSGALQLRASVPHRQLRSRRFHLEHSPDRVVDHQLSESFPFRRR